MQRVAAARLAMLGVVVMISSGCGSKTAPGWGGRNVSWSRVEADKEPLPGIDSADVKFGTYGDDFAPVFWSDSVGGGIGGRWDSARKQVHYEGHSYAADGRAIRVECFTADGKTGTVTIDGREYRLEEGPLFLIKTTGPEVAVRPIQIDRAKLRGDSEQLRELAASEKAISSFFRGTAGSAP